MRRSVGIVRYDTTEVGFRVQFHLPLRVELKDRVKAIMGARWVRARRSWFVPASKARALLEALHGHAFELDASSRAAFERVANDASVQVDASQWAEVSEPKRTVQSPIMQEAAAYRARQAELSLEPTDAPQASVNHERSASMRVPRSRAQVPAPSAQSYPSVYALTRRVDAALRHTFGAPQWVVGVVQGVTHSRQGHVYFRLKDVDPEIGADRAILNVAMFGRTAKRVLAALTQHQLVLEDGMTLALCGEVRLYAPRSSLQLIAQDVDVRVSRGEVELQRDRVVAALRDAGLSWKNTRVPLPALPEHIALITSAHGDALHDVLRTLRHGEVGARCTLYDVPVQGAGLEAAVLRVLGELEVCDDRPDLVLIVRGGGAANELAWWDNVKVGTAVANSTVPVVVGIGHERDETALHEVARFEATPTAAAQQVVQLWRDARVRVAETMERLAASSSQILDVRQQQLSRTAERFHHAADRQMMHAELRVREVLVHDVEDAVRRAWDRHAAALDVAQAQLVRHAARVQEQAEQRCEDAAHAVSAYALERTMRAARAALDTRAQAVVQRAQRQLQRRTRELVLAERTVRASDPQRWLQRGYALVRDAEGAIVTDAAALHPGGALTIQLAQGRVRAVVDSTEDG